MCMAILTRRLQILLEEKRFAQLESLARQRETTVAQLVREALDRAYPSSGLPAEIAADRFLARPPLDFGTWEEAKREIEEGLGRGLPS